MTSPVHTLLTRLKANPDFMLAVASGYGLTAIQMAVQLLLVPLYLSTLGVWQFGVLMMTLSFVNFAAIGIGWMSGGALRVLGEYAAANDNDGFRHAYLMSRLIFTGYASLVATGMVLAGATMPWLFGEEARQHAAELRWAAVAAGCYVVLMYDLSIQRIAFTALKRQATGNVLQIVSVVTFVALAVPWLRSAGGLAGVLTCLAAGAAVARLASTVAWRRALPQPRARYRRERLLPLARRLSGPMGAGFFLYGMCLLAAQADVMIVGLLGGAAAAAKFALIWRVAEVLILVISKLPEFLIPDLIHLDAGGHRSRLANIYQHADRVLIAVSLVAGIIYALAGQRIVALWVGAEHAPREPWAFALAGGAVFWLGIARLPAVFAYAMVKLRALNAVAGVEAGGKIALTLVLFPVLGHVAPLVATNAVHVSAVAFAYRRLGKLVS